MMALMKRKLLWMLLQVWEESYEKVCKAAQERFEKANNDNDDQDWKARRSKGQKVNRLEC